MSATDEIRITLEQEAGYAFRVRFESVLASLLTDESPPLGSDRGPNPSQLLLVAVANCLGASLVFALRKFKNQPGPLRARISARPERNAEGRWRIPRASVELELAEGGEAHQHLERILQQFEDFCVVTQSVRDGIAIAVTVKDAHGHVLHGEPGSAAGA